MNQPKVLAFCGSLRKDSWNKKLMLFAVKELEAQGAQAKVIDLNDLNFPIFNEDDETQRGLPDTAEKFIEAIKEADGLVIASPEYNGGVTAALKNTIDWATRGDGNPFHEKPILVMGTSPGA